MKRILILVATLAAMLSAVPASATTLLYSITGNGFSASFALDSKPVVLADPLQPGTFFIFDVPGAYWNGTSVAGLTFYDTASAGGMTINTTTPTGMEDFSFTGAAMFSGTLANPTLLPFDAITFYDYADPRRTYMVSAIAAAVPEPATWAMLLVGFGMIGVVARRRTPVAIARLA